MVLTLLAGLSLPLLGFLVLMASSQFIHRQAAGVIACVTIFISFLCFASFLSSSSGNQDVVEVYRWLHFGSINADFTLHLDHLSLLMTLIITGVGFLIHVYSIGYMEHEEDYARYFACLNFFVFAMLLLVLAGDLLVLFIGWEGVGLASYLLIGFWYEKPSAAFAATKAFVVNRIGDLAFLLGILLAYHLFETSNISAINQLAGQKFAIGTPVIILFTFLLFIGATGKSAQIPLHTWLPDAMEGPTPVSALIHAATMVTAGVYLIVRLHPVFLLAPLTLQTIGLIGGTTALFASLSAVGQTDLKRVLAYSTVSQLGLMFLACGAGAFYSAMFHLTMHAFVKALLFLSAGNVVHMLHDVTDMRRMGNLDQKFPKTHWLFFIGVLGLSGIPPLATFFSKDLILEQEYLAGFEVLFYVGLVASILTGFYLMRAYCLTFKVAAHDKALVESAHEAPSVMLTPVTILACLSVFGGFLGFAFGKRPILEDFLQQVGITLAEKKLSQGLVLSYESILAIVGALVGVGSSYYLYTHYADRSLRFLKRAFYVDDIYERLIVNPLRKLSKAIFHFFEPFIFEGSIKASVVTTREISSSMQMMQSGQVRSYIAWMVIGTVITMIYIVS